MTQANPIFHFSAAALAMAFLLLLPASIPRPALAWQQALQPRTLTFPRDHGQHGAFQTEWWYLTGNLTAKNGRSFGFQFTLFRRGVRKQTATDNLWAVRDLYLLHSSLSDFSRKHFYTYEDASRTGPGLAGASRDTLKTWFKGNLLQWDGNKTISLHCQTDNYALDFTFSPDYPRPILHGDRGLSRKGPGQGQASYYYSLPRLLTSGTITLDGKPYRVSGLSWYDHEFATSQLGKDQQGWDWISLHLDDGSSLMIYQLRRKDGTVSPFSSGTFIFPDGRYEHLHRADFSLMAAKRRWQSPDTGISWPLWWQLTLKKPRVLELSLRPKMVNQEMKTMKTTRTIYWEGSITAAENRNGEKTVKGEGYLELTGYGQNLPLSGSAGR